MNRNSIRWRLPASYGVIALLAALLLGSVMMLVLKNYYARQEQDYMLRNAFALQPMLEQVLQTNPQPGLLQDQLDGLSFLSQTQIRVLDASGDVMADSGVPASNQVVSFSGGASWSAPAFESAPGVAKEKMPILIYKSNAENNVAGVPEVIPFDDAIPYSGPASKADIVVPVSASPYGYIFVARTEANPKLASSQLVSVPLRTTAGDALGALEISNGPSYGADVINSVSSAWLLASAFAVVIAALTGWFMSQRVTRPVLALENATRQMEQGDLSVRVHLRDERQQEFLSLAHSFNGMATQVEQTISTLREFVADAAHELHTPLTALQANIELARNEKISSERTRFLSRAQEQGRRLEGLVQSLLDLSRIEAAESRSTFEPVDMVQLGREIGEQFASRAEQADRSFTMSLSNETVTVFGNKAQLRQVLINLLENALKFTPQNGLISVELKQPENECRLIVGDTGIGIPLEDRAHLFERFHRGRNASEFAGNGLGLAIVKAIVSGHGGNVTIQSQPGLGTQVMVTLPIFKTENV